MAGNHHSTHPSLLLVSGGQPPIFFSLLILTILLFGCAGQASQAQAPAGNTTTPAGDQSPQPYIPQANPQPPAPGPYSGLDFAALAALDSPIQCNITSVYQGRSFQSQVWMKGASQMRVESVGGAGLSQCTKTISVVEGSKVYVGCEGKQVIPSCDWFVSAYNPQAPGLSSTFDFTNLPPAQMDCRDWAYDPSQFLAKGNDCSMGG